MKAFIGMNRMIAFCQLKEDNRRSGLKVKNKILPSSDLWIPGHWSMQFLHYLCQAAGSRGHYARSDLAVVLPSSRTGYYLKNFELRLEHKS